MCVCVLLVFEWACRWHAPMCVCVCVCVRARACAATYTTSSAATRAERKSAYGDAPSRTRATADTRSPPAYSIAPRDGSLPVRARACRGGVNTCPAYTRTSERTLDEIVDQVQHVLDHGRVRDRRERCTQRRAVPRRSLSPARAAAARQ